MTFHKLNSARLSKNGKNKHAFMYLVLKSLYDTSIEKKRSIVVYQTIILLNSIKEYLFSTE